MGIEIEVKTGDHSLDYDINGSKKLVNDALELVSVEEGKFLLCLMDKDKGSSFKKGFKLSRREKNVFHGTLQTGDNSSCFKFKLIIPEEINAAHLYSQMWLLCHRKKKVKREALGETKKPELKVIKKAPWKKAKLFDGAAFLADEECRGLLSIYIQEDLSSKKAKIFSVADLRELMIRRGVIGEEVNQQSVNRFCFAAVRRNIFKIINSKSPRKRYALTEEAMALGMKKDGNKELPIQAETAKVEEKRQTSFNDLYAKLELLTNREVGLSKKIKEMGSEIQNMEAELLETSAEKNKVKEELHYIIDEK